VGPLTFAERIARGREAIARARAEGRDVREWVAHLARLESLAEAEGTARATGPFPGPAGRAGGAVGHVAGTPEPVAAERAGTDAPAVPVGVPGADARARYAEALAEDRMRASRAASTGGACASPWPDILPDLGPRRVGTFTPCAQCGAGSWVRYGEAVRCLSCATTEAASLTAALHLPWSRS
jgi:hypothetical protein